MTFVNLKSKFMKVTLTPAPDKFIFAKQIKWDNHIAQKKKNGIKNIIMNIIKKIADNYKNRNGVFYPLQLELELTRRCNLNCWHCWRNFNDYDPYELTDDFIIEIVSELVNHGLMKLEFPGAGEPLLRKGLIHEISKQFGERLELSLTTNGTLFEISDVMNFVLNSFDTIYFSLDFPDLTHDKNRGSGVFKKIDDTLIEFMALKKSRRCSTPEIRFKTVIFPEFNLEHAENLFNYAKSRGINEIFFLPFEDYDNKQVNIIKFDLEFMKKVNNYGIKSNLDEFIVDTVILDDPNDVVCESCECKPRCFYPWYNILISSDGKAGPCCNSSRFQLRTTSDVMKIWNEDFDIYRKIDSSICNFCSNYTPGLWKEVNELSDS
ncbi:radical SAM protein [bacterium]|nr:radical SAM protein [bacterium]